MQQLIKTTQLQKKTSRITFEIIIFFTKNLQAKKNNNNSKQKKRDARIYDNSILYSIYPLHKKC